MLVAGCTYDKQMGSVSVFILRANAQIIKAANAMMPLFANILVEGAEGAAFSTSSEFMPSPWAPFTGLKAEKTELKGLYEFTFILPEGASRDLQVAARGFIPDILLKFGWNLHGHVEGTTFRVMECDNRRGIIRHLSSS